MALVAACSGRSASSDTTSGRSSPTGGNTAAAVGELFQFGLSFGQSRQALEARLGPPENVDVALVRNAHVPEATDSLFTLFYPGLIFRLNRPGPVDRELLVEVILSGEERDLPGGLRVGSSRTAALERLGATTSRVALGDTLVAVYEVPQTDVDDFVQLYFVDDSIALVRWLPYVD